MPAPDPTGPHAVAAIDLIDKYGDAALRNAVVAAFFFDKAPEVIAPQVVAALDVYLAAIPQDALKYAVTSAAAGQFKPFGPATLTACRKQLASAGVAKRELTEVRLNSDGDDASTFEFLFVGRRPDADSPEAVSALSMLFPVDFIAGPRKEQLVSMLRAVSESLDYCSGYCSPALVPMLNALDGMIAKSLRGLALRHPGYDLPSSRETSFLLGRRIHAPGWITWLGPELVSALGGGAGLHKLPPPIAVEPLMKGVMIRASVEPELGDVNRRIDTPQLRRVAAALEPVTMFGDTFSTIYQTFGDDDLLRRWERRFLDAPDGP